MSIPDYQILVCGVFGFMFGCHLDECLRDPQNAKNYPPLTTIATIGMLLYFNPPWLFW